MNIHVFFSLLGALLCFTLASYVIIKNRQNYLNQIFSILCYFFSIWSFTEFQIRQAESAQRALTWIHVSGIWPIAIALLIHFIIVYTNPFKVMAFKVLISCAYLCAFFFSYCNLFVIDYHPSLFYWGWSFDYPDSVIFNMSKIWAITFTLLSIIIITIYSFRTPLRSIRIQSRYIIFGISVVFISGAASECVLPFFSMRIPELTQTSFTLMAAFVGIAIWKHQLFALDPSIAAETIISTMTDSLAVVNLDHKIEIVNKSLVTWLGYSAEELIGKDLNCIIGNFKYQDSTLTTLLKKDFLSDIETTFRKKDGTLIPVSLSWSILKDNNKFRGFVFIGRDMSERDRIKGALQKAHDELEKRVEERTAELKKSNSQLLHEISERIDAEQKLAEEKERLAVTLKSIGDGVVTTDVQGKVILLNKAAEELTGYSSEDAIGKELNEIFHTERALPREPYVSSIFEEIQKNSNSSQFERRSLLITTSGKEFTVDETGVSIKDHHNETVGFVLVFRDVTEKYRLEQELFKARKLESVSLLASGIAHDFGNLLTGIITNLFMAKVGMDTTTDNFQLITTAEKAAFKASVLTKQLLTFADNNYSVKVNTSIKELMENSIGYYLKNSKSEYKLNFSEADYEVSIDRGQFDQVFNNIISNADQAMPDGGVINVDAENIIIEQNDSLPVHPGSYLKISITDQGPGISNEMQQRIFDPYFTTRKDSIGLGLTTAYAIVQNHGGHISVESRMGVGTTFSIYLPATNSETDEKKSDQLAKEQSKGKVLFIDDEETILKSTGQILFRLGYEAALVENYHRGLTVFKDAYDSSDPFSIVLMDLSISGDLNAKDAIREFQQIDPDVKVIVSSGYTDDPVMTDYSSFGFCGAIPKPYSIEILQNAIQESINLRC